MSQFEVLGNFVYQTKNQLRNTEIVLDSKTYNVQNSISSLKRNAISYEEMSDSHSKGECNEASTLAPLVAFYVIEPQ